MGQLRWNDPEQVHIPMVQEVKEEIETLNFVQIVEGVTKSWPGTEDGLLDQCWVNNPEKVLSCRNIVRSAGDHNAIEVTFRMKGKITAAQEIRRRDWKAMNLRRFQQGAKSI